MMAFWLGLPKWAQHTIIFAGALLACILTGKWALARHDDGVRKDQQQKQEIETGKERERVIETSHQVIDDIEDAKDAAIAAPYSVPVVNSADELREQAPAIAGVILRDRR